MMRTCLVAVCFLLLAASVVDARIDDVGFYGAKGELVKVGLPFGVEAGGTVSVDLYLQRREHADDDDPRGDYGYLVMLSSAQYSYTTFYGSDSPCLWTSVAVNYTVAEKDTYYLYFMNCFERHFDLYGEVTWENPTSKTPQLSLEEGHLYDVVALICLPMGIALAATVALLRGRPAQLVYTKLGLAILLALASNLALVFYFKAYAESGVPKAMLRYLSIFLTVLGDTVFLSALLLLAMGWRISRHRLSVRNKQLLFGSLFLFAGFDVAYLICSYPENLCAIYLLFFVIIKFLILFSMVIAVNGEMEYLRSELGVARDRVLLGIRLHLFHRIRRILVILMVVPVVVILLQLTVLSWENTWLAVAIDRLLFTFAILAVSYAVRPLPRSSGRRLFLDAPRRENRNTDNHVGGHGELMGPEEEEEAERDEDNGSDAGSEDELLGSFDQEAFNAELEPDGIMMEQIETPLDTEQRGTLVVRNVTEPEADS